MNIQYHYASDFFLATFFGFASATTAAETGFLEADLFNCALILFLFLDTPKEPMVLFPLADFLSPLPIELK